jgi:hypothetical protein
MAKITMTLCDVAPCSFIAEREFEVNGQIVYVCGENCFVKFWSREYRNWKNEKYHMEAHLGVEDNSIEVKKTIINESRQTSADLQVVRPAKFENSKYIARVEQ